MHTLCTYYVDMIIIVVIDIVYVIDVYYLYTFSVSCSVFNVFLQK